MFTDNQPHTVPLAAWMKGRLVADCWPFIAMLVFLILAVAVLPQFLNVPVLLPLFLGFVALVLGFQAVQRIRDLISGVALVESDVLERSWRSRGQGRIFFAKFERMGKLRIMPKAHFQSHNGARYRVTYSPISKIVWTLEALD
jgi:hypothetical protein